MTVYDIVKKIIGPIKAVGETNQDKERLENLKAQILLVEILIEEIKQASMDSDRYEYSMKQIGQLAKKALTEIKNNID